MVLSYLVGQKKYPIAYPLKDIAVYVVAAMALYALMVAGSRHLSSALSLGVNIVLILSFCALIVKKDLPLSSLPVIGRHFKKRQKGEDA